MKLRLLCVSLLALAMGVPYAVAAADAESKSEFKASCPLSGKPAKESSNLKFQGKKVYFCCNKCPKAFAKKTSDKDSIDPKLMAKVRHQWLQTGQMVQVGCPISGKEIDPDMAVELNGAKFSFCCKKCKGKYAKASADEKLAIVFGDKAKGFTTQTKCPLTGKPIKADVTTEHKGKTVYFCCPGCIGKFEKNPEKYMARINAAGLSSKTGN